MSTEKIEGDTERKDGEHLRREIHRLVSLRRGELLATGRNTRAPAHQPLSPAERSIANTAVIRFAGYTKFGKPMGPSELREDLRAVLSLESKLVVDPIDMGRQLDVMMRIARAAREQGREIHDQDLPKYAQLGGHAFANTFENIVEVLRMGYVFLLEYEVGSRTLLGGTMYGFDRSFAQHPRFPSLGLHCIGAPPSKIDELIGMQSDLVTNWRTSVPEDFTQVIPAHSSVPDALIDPSSPVHSRRMGAGTRLKSMLCHPKKTALMLNIGFIQAMGDLLGTDVQIPNRASDRYNRELLRRSPYTRRHFDVLRTKEGVDVAEVHWQVYWNWISDAIAAVEREGGVLKGKGIDLESDRKWRGILWNILDRRSKILSLVEKL